MTKSQVSPQFITHETWIHHYPFSSFLGKPIRLCRTSQCLRLFVKQRCHASSWAILTFLTFWTYCASKASCILLPDWFIDVHCYSEYSGRFVVLSNILVGCFCMFLWSLSGRRFTWGHWEFGADGDQALWCQHPKFGEGRAGNNKMCFRKSTFGCWSATIEKTEYEVPITVERLWDLKQPKTWWN